MMGSFEQARIIELPGWLADPTGEGYQRALGRAQDVELRRLKDAVLAAFPATAPEDAAQLIGHDQDLEQAPGESTEDFLARCERALDIWYWGGTKRGIEEILEPLGVDAAHVHVLNDHETSYVDDGSGWWSRVWTIVDSYPGPWTKDGNWGDSGTWGDGGLWGCSMSVDELSYIRRRIRKMKNPGAYPVALFLVLDDSVTGDGVWGGLGTWGDGGNWGSGAAAPLVVPIAIGHVWGEETAIYGVGTGLWGEPGDVWSAFE
ncbi:hypothetical protein [Sorangium sp. So ce1000]|uniref:hypothetical protein n=1 Tax=Sorangium sp. So ce1000 TaxID=3133325 RepID=UPI003F5E8704